MLPMIVSLSRAVLLALGTCLLCLPAPPAEAQRRTASAPADKANRLNALYAQYWDALMKLDPLQATLQGDARYNDQLPNTLSLAFRQQYLEFNREWLALAEAIGADGLQGQDLLSYQIFVRDTRAALAGRDHPTWMLPVNPYYNPATIIALLGSGAGAQPFNTVKDYENWSRRSLGIPTLFNQAIENMRQGIAAGVVQPRALMEKVLPQLDAVLAAGTAQDSLFWGPIRAMPEDFSPADRERLSAEYQRMIDNRILPAYRALRGFIATEYLPACRDSDGLGALPGGTALYAHNIIQYTTISQDPQQLHQQAQTEVTRLQGEITTTLRSHRIRGRRERAIHALHTDKAHALPSAQALVEAYQQAGRELATPLAAVMPALELAPLQILPLDPSRALTASAASYQPPSGNDQPGTLWINTHDLASRPRWAITQQYLHEAIPGHHLQLGQRGCMTSRTSSWATCMPACCAPRASWSIPACMPRAGAASRPRNTCRRRPTSVPPMPRWRSNARWPCPARPCRRGPANGSCASCANTPARHWASSSTCASSMPKSCVTVRCRWISCRPRSSAGSTARPPPPPPRPSEPDATVPSRAAGRCLGLRPARPRQ